MLCLFFVFGVAFANENVIVIRDQFSFELEYTLDINSSVEYMLEFVPNAEQSQYPSKFWLKTNGGDTTHPLLITARQRFGAITWQLPYYSVNQLLYEMERTLCPDSAEDGDSDCGPLTDASRVPNSFFLHISSSCDSLQTVTINAAPVRNFVLPFQQSTVVSVRLAIPTVNYYKFSEGQNSVRLELQSEQEICALVSVQNVSCPILQTEEQIPQAGLRMTMLRSGGVHLSRSRFPLGFYLVAVVLSSDEPCTGTAEEDEAWLWDAIWSPEEAVRVARPRNKDLAVIVQASLTRGQYLIATFSTLLFCLLFYVMFFALVWAQRWPAFEKYVAPKAKLAEVTQTETGQIVTDGVTNTETPHGMRRRDSTATFDSSEDSSSDEDDTCPSPVSPHLTPSNSPIPASNSQIPCTNSHVSPTNSQITPTNPQITPTNPQITPPNRQITPTNTQNSTSNSQFPPNNYKIPSTISQSPTVPTTPPRTPTNSADNPTFTPDTMVNAETSETTEVRGGVHVTDGALAQPNGGQLAPTPFGLPASLRLAALSRHRTRVLRARSDRYLHTLYTVAVFYGLPVLQFVSAFQLFLNVSGSLDVCYYNFLCSHPAGSLSDFNHIFSNLGYLLLGALFMLQLRRRRLRRLKQPRNEEYGIPAHYGMLSSLGAAMMVVGVLSASYHVCPNRLNFQFDTAFMYVLAVVSMVKIYQSRHPDVNARAHATFAVLALLIALVVWGVLRGGAFFWAMFTVLHLFTFLLLSLRIYYVGQFRLEKHTLQMAARGLADLSKHGVRPLYRTRLVMLLIANGVNWTIALYGLWSQSADIAGHLLQLLLCNTLLYMVFYLTMKLVHGERPRWYAWGYLAGAAAAWVPALYFFVSGSSDWSATAAASRHLNHQCMVLQFYDSHDLWHMLSAVALYLSFNAMLTWDDGLAAVKRTEIAVF